MQLFKYAIILSLLIPFSTKAASCKKWSTIALSKKKQVAMNGAQHITNIDIDSTISECLEWDRSDDEILEKIYKHLSEQQEKTSKTVETNIEKKLLVMLKSLPKHLMNDEAIKLVRQNVLAQVQAEQKAFREEILAQVKGQKN